MRLQYIACCIDSNVIFLYLITVGWRRMYNFLYACFFLSLVYSVIVLPPLKEL